MPLRLTYWQLTKEQALARMALLAKELVTKMSPAAREYFERQAVPIITAKPPLLARLNLHESDFLWKPVEIEQFCNDNYYLGSILRGNVYEKILQDLVSLFKGNYSEVLLAGSIGWG